MCLMSLLDPSGAPDQRRRRLARWVIVAGALVGLFVMHGLDDHGTGRPTDHQSSASAGPHQAHPEGLSAIAADAVAVVQGATAEPSAPEHGPGALMAMCLAVLVLVVFAVGLALTSRRAAWVELGPAMRTAVGAHTSRERDPPCLIRLSIQRC